MALGFFVSGGEVQVAASHTLGNGPGVSCLAEIGAQSWAAFFGHAIRIGKLHGASVDWSEETTDFRLQNWPPHGGFGFPSHRSKC